MTANPQQSLKWIKARRSVRPNAFASGDVSTQEILDLLEAARWAPTHKLTQPWRFTVFRGAAKARLAEMQCAAITVNAASTPEQLTAKQAKIRLNAQQSAAIIAICMKRDEAKRLPEFEEVAAVSCAVQNLWLYAASLGLCGYWSTGAGINNPHIRAELKLAPDDLHLGWFYLGRLAMSPEPVAEPKNRLPIEAVVQVLEG